MNNTNKIEKQISELRIGDFIFIIWIVNSLIGLSSNLIEEESVETRDPTNLKLVENLRLTAIYISITIYIYLLIRSYRGVINNMNNPNEQAVTNSKIKFITSILFIISGLLLLYLQKNDVKDDFDIYV